MPISLGASGKIAFYPAAGDTIDDASQLYYINNNSEFLSTGRNYFLRNSYDTRHSGLLSLAQYQSTTPLTIPLNFTRGRNSSTTPAAVQVGDQIGRLVFSGATGEGTTVKGGAYINAVVSDTVTTDDVPMKIVFGLLTNGTVPSNKIEIQRDKLVVAGNTEISGDLFVTGEVTAYFSDERLKKDITPITGALDKVMAISGYTYKSNEQAEELGIGRIDNQIGLLAQEVEAVMPELVTNSAIEGYKTVRYDKLVSVLVNAVKEQQQMIDELKNIINTKLA